MLKLTAIAKEAMEEQEQGLIKEEG